MEYIYGAREGNQKEEKMNIFKIWNELKVKQNVNGISQVIQKKIIEGRTTDTPCIRVYVTKKKPLDQLSLHDEIPKMIDDIRTDVVEIGEIKILQVDKTAKRRPVDIGISVGHWQITAGSLGMHYIKDGQLYIGSNAHVLTPSADLPVDGFTEKRITQPGPYHLGGGGGDDDGDSWCPLSRVIVFCLNKIWALLGRSTRFKATLPKQYEEYVVGNYFWHSQIIADQNNVQDFGVYSPLVEHVSTIADGSVDPNAPFIGHLFAGGDTLGVICKVKYAIEQGFIPIVQIAEVVEGDVVHGVSFWCNYRTVVTDRSAIIQVSYGNFIATFVDQIIVENDGTIIGGWSGSGWRKI